MKLVKNMLIALFTVFSVSGVMAQKSQKKILFVVTSTSQKGKSGQKTGYFLSEVSHPWKVLHDAGYVIDFISPNGGQPPVDAFNLNDPVNKEFWENSEYNKKINNSMKPSDVNPSEYSAIYYAGGHGTMWDFPENKEIADIAAKIYQAGGVIGAVCHGPSGLVNIKLSNGKYLIDGKKINSFTNEEENINGNTDILPFMLETKLRENGAIYEKSNPWQVHVVVDQRVVTGQNPMSATSVGEGMIYALKGVK
jgi:Putative intracellular protease/amidase